MDKFEYQGKAEIRHLNVRKEGPEDDKNLAVDVKIQCIAGADMLDFFHEGIKDVLYTDVGAVKNLFLKKLEFNNTIMNCELEIIKQRYLGVNVGKISLEPKDGHQVTMTFSVSIAPNGDDVANLAEFVMDEVDIHIRPQPELDFGGVADAVNNINALLKEDGATATLSTGGEVVAKFGDYDELYDAAVKVVREKNTPSISLVQRHLRIGYNRAARLLEQMESEGVVSAMQSNGSRSMLA